MKTIKLTDGSEINPQQAIRIQHDSHSSYSFDQYVSDLEIEFKMSKEEAEQEVNKFFNLK